jgi:hypothetical protein
VLLVFQDAEVLLVVVEMAERGASEKALRVNR